MQMKINLSSISGRIILHLQKLYCSRIHKCSEGVLFSLIALLQFITIQQEKSKGKKNSQIAEHISVQLQNDLNQYKSILLLAMNGCFNSVIVEYRSLYESFVIGQYLVQNPDLVPVYKDHLQFLRYHLTQLVGNSKPEWDKIHDEYLNKYGQEFAENYGWTKNKIPRKKDRKIGTLAKECNLEDSFFSSEFLSSPWHTQIVISSQSSIAIKSIGTLISGFFFK